jgi:hypothetical protein
MSGFVTHGILGIGFERVTITMPPLLYESWKTAHLQHFIKGLLGTRRINLELYRHLH